jgi:hypothetical protein
MGWCRGADLTLFHSFVVFLSVSLPVPSEWPFLSLWM